MDPIAHSLVGASMAETGLRSRTPLATATLIIGANLPDLDAITTVLGRDASLYYRRGWTHGVLAMAILPLALVAAMWLYDRAIRRRRDPDAEPVRWGWLIGLAYLATLSHPLLDLLNTYGVRLLMPFDGRWFYGDALFIVDPWMWLLTGAAVVLARSKKRLSVGSWILLGCATTGLIAGTDYAPGTAKLLWVVGLSTIVWARWRGTMKTTWVARAGLSVLLGYVAVMVVSSRLAVDRGSEWARGQGHSVRSAMAAPLPADPVRWDVILETADGYRFLDVNLLDEAGVHESDPPMPGDVRPPTVEHALSDPSVRGMVNWMRYPSYVVQPSSEGRGHDVTILDVRYSRFGAKIGQAHVHVPSDDE